MVIKECSTNVQEDKRLQYRLTKAPDVKKLKDAVDSLLTVKAYCVYDDSKEGENEKIILTLLDDTGTVYGTNSKTALANFKDIDEFFDNELYEGGLKLNVKSSVSKNGREFIMLDYAG